MLPELSEDVYVIVYVPSAFVLTVPATRTALVPSMASVAVAPGSVYVPPNVTDIGFAPFRVMTGADASTFVPPVPLGISLKGIEKLEISPLTPIVLIL